MQTLESFGRHIQSVHDLQSVVKTMKGLAAVNIRQYEEAVDALRDYSRSLELGMQIVLQQSPGTWNFSPPDSDRRVAIVLLGSDQGMCGQFNSRIVAHADVAHVHDECADAVLGHHAAVPVYDVLPGVGRVAGVGKRRPPGGHAGRREERRGTTRPT